MFRIAAGIPLAGLESLDVVGQHSLEPFDAVGARDGENGPVGQVQPARGRSAHAIVLRVRVAEVRRQAPSLSFDEARAVLFVEVSEGRYLHGED